MDDTARLVVTVLIAAFVIERITAAITFLTETPPAERRRKLPHFLVAAVLGALAVWLAHIRVLATLGNKVSPWVDCALSWLVLVAGADRIREFVGGGGGGGAAKPAPAPPPIQILIEEKDGHTTARELPAS